MKFIILLCCLVAVSSAMNVQQLVTKQERAFEAELMAAAEKFRDIIINGDPENDIPIMDPYTNDTASFELSVPETAEIVAKLFGVKMVGLKDFVVHKLSINVLRFRLDFNFTLPILEMSADDYDLDGNIAGTPLFGKGKARVAITGIKASGYAVVSVSQMTLKEFKLVLGIKEFQSDIQGLLGGGDVSIFINEVLQTLVPSLINDNQEKITNFIEKKVLERANSMLSGPSNDIDISHMIKNFHSMTGLFLKNLMNY
ncbi:uncharacterized protein LOC143913186 [Arctopsyche grandis]|uniref:uncharacterized protein LOC143913186 n=1 Tax=Arctopsyche grandis TaxID=121162 RepID=UPI00406D76B3